MNQQNKADCIPGRYFPCLADYTNVTFECQFKQKSPLHNYISVHCGLALALAHMGSQVHFIIDKENKTLYICPHKKERDGQAPLWHAVYQANRVDYLCNARDMFNSEPFSMVLTSTIESFSEIPVEKQTKHYKISGYYSYELEALVFPLSSDKVLIEPKCNEDSQTTDCSELPSYANSKLFGLQ